MHQLLIPQENWEIFHSYLLQPEKDHWPEENKNRQAEMPGPE